MKLGIVGTGNIAYRHFEEFSKIDGVKIEAVCDINSESLNFSGKFSVTIAGPLYVKPNFKLSSNKKVLILEVIFTSINVSGY